MRLPSTYASARYILALALLWPCRILTAALPSCRSPRRELTTSGSSFCDFDLRIHLAPSRRGLHCPPLFGSYGEAAASFGFSALPSRSPVPSPLPFSFLPGAAYSVRVRLLRTSCLLCPLWSLRPGGTYPAMRASRRTNSPVSARSICLRGIGHRHSLVCVYLSVSLILTKQPAPSERWPRSVAGGAQRP